MTPRTMNIVCARAPVRVPCVPAILTRLRRGDRFTWHESGRRVTVTADFDAWLCSLCGARVRVVA